jgi:hypothetical protein
MAKNIGGKASKTGIGGVISVKRHQRASRKRQRFSGALWRQRPGNARRA